MPIVTDEPTEDVKSTSAPSDPIETETPEPTDPVDTESPESSYTPVAHEYTYFGERGFCADENGDLYDSISVHRYGGSLIEVTPEECMGYCDLYDNCPGFSIRLSEDSANGAICYVHFPHGELPSELPDWGKRNDDSGSATSGIIANVYGNSLMYCYVKGGKNSREFLDILLENVKNRFF